MVTSERTSTGAAGAGAGVYFGTRTDGPPTTTLGNIVFGK